MQFSRFWLGFPSSLSLSQVLSCPSLFGFRISLGRDQHGGKRTRTADILLAKQALYQLSYTPIFLMTAIDSTKF